MLVDESCVSILDLPFLMDSGNMLFIIMDRFFSWE